MWALKRSSLGQTSAAGRRVLTICAQLVPFVITDGLMLFGLDATPNEGRFVSCPMAEGQEKIDRVAS